MSKKSVLSLFLVISTTLCANVTTTVTTQKMLQKFLTDQDFFDNVVQLTHSVSFVAAHANQNDTVIYNDKPLHSLERTVFCSEMIKNKNSNDPTEWENFLSQVLEEMTNDPENHSCLSSTQNAVGVQPNTTVNVSIIFLNKSNQVLYQANFVISNQEN